MREFTELEEKQVSSKAVYDGVLLHVYKDDVALPDGSPSVRELIRLLGAVAVVPVTEDGKVIIEKQFRYPLNRVITEIPAGKLDSATEDPLEAAKRELLEETGYRAEEWTFMGSYQPSPAYCDEKIYLYLAQGLQAGEQKLDQGEFLNVEQVPLTELVEDVMQGRIQDGKTQVAILKAAQLLQEKEREARRLRQEYEIISKRTRMTEEYNEKIPESEITIQFRDGVIWYVFSYQAHAYEEYGVSTVSWLDQKEAEEEFDRSKHILESYDSIKDSIHSDYAELFLELHDMMLDAEDYVDQAGEDMNQDMPYPGGMDIFEPNPYLF